jgi:hypothetical protein
MGTHGETQTITAATVIKSLAGKSRNSDNG